MNSEWIAQMEAYLEGGISKAELEAKATEFGVKDMEEELAWFQNSQLAIEAAGLREQLSEALPKPQQGEKKVFRLRSIRTVLAIAASILVLFVAYIALNNEEQSDLYAAYVYVDPGLPVLMSQSDDYLLYDALTYYSEKDYKLAAEKLQALESQYPQSDTLAYYLGASLLYQGQTQAAKKALNKVRLNEASTFAARTDWLLVLAALKEKEMEEVKSGLQQILGTPGHEFFDQASKLSAEIE